MRINIHDNKHTSNGYVKTITKEKDVMIITQIKLDQDKRDYYREFADWVNARWKSVEDYEQRAHIYALEFCQSIGIELAVKDDELIFNATGMPYAEIHCG